jgi:hypothetical protein
MKKVLFFLLGAATVPAIGLTQFGIDDLRVGYLLTKMYAEKKSDFNTQPPLTFKALNDKYFDLTKDSSYFSTLEKSGPVVSLLGGPITDKLAEGYMEANAAMKVRYNTMSATGTEPNTSATPLKVSSSGYSYNYMPLAEIVAYCGTLLHPNYQGKDKKITGLNLMPGLIDTNTSVQRKIFDALRTSSNTNAKLQLEYFIKGQGSMLTVLYPVVTVGDSIQELSKEAPPVDCNCGNPPTCGGGRRDYTCSIREIEERKTCAACPR